MFDYDWGLQDDFMGASKLSLLSLDLNQQTEIKLRLEDPSRPEKDLGELVLSVILWPKTQEDKEQVSAHTLTFQTFCLFKSTLKLQRKMIKILSDISLYTRHLKPHGCMSESIKTEKGFILIYFNTLYAQHLFMIFL